MLHAMRNFGRGNQNVLVKSVLRPHFKTSKALIKENCIGGCPCPNYSCAETTPSPDVTTPSQPDTTTSPNVNAVLILSTYENSNTPMIMDFNGKYSFLKFIYFIQRRFGYFLFKEMSMMISILNMVKERQLPMAVERPLWVNFGILAVVNKYVF